MQKLLELKKCIKTSKEYAWGKSINVTSSHG
jgi:hypothetical protein